jgi:hypothetical protein
MHFRKIPQEDFVLCHLHEPRLTRELEHAKRIMICAIPKNGIEMAKKAARRRLPSPPKVENHFPQRLELGW